MWSRFAPGINVLPLYGVLNQRVETMPEFRQLGFVMEYSGLGDLSRHLQSDRLRKMTRSQKLRFMLAIASAIHAGHSYMVVHGDIKPKNVLLFLERGTLIPKVMDFGMSASASGDSHIHGGTPEYMAPECFDTVSHDRSHLNHQSDIYSLGALFFEIVCARPFTPPTEGKGAFTERWENCKAHHRSVIVDLIEAEAFSRIFAKLLGDMLSKQPSQRPDIANVVKRMEAALDETERFSILNPEAEIAVPSGRFRWNVHFHSKSAASLYYFMIKGRWSKADIPWLQTKLEEVQIRAYSLYRVLGAFDFILRAWLRQSHFAKVKDALERFADVHQGHFETFVADKVQPFYQSFFKPFTGTQEEALDAILEAERLPEMEQIAFLQRVNLGVIPPALDRARRRFFLLFPIGRAGSEVQGTVIDYYADRIAKALEHMPEARQVSIYSGKGYFSVIGKVRCDGIEEFRTIHSQLVDHCMTFRLNDFPISIQTYVELYEPVREADDGTLLGDAARRKRNL